MTTRKTIAPDLSSFEQLRTSDKLYVDKTEYIWELVQSAPAEYFLSRPRRFGKSLTLTTLKAVFEGKKELFKGLAIYGKPYDWKAYPVIHLDMGNCMATNAAELEAFLEDLLKEVAWKNGIALEGRSVSAAFRFLIDRLSGERPVVVLVDEYDKPILNNVLSEEVGGILKVLKGFYSTIKTCAASIRFAFITGVSKFCHVSLFSDLNNLQDLTMDARFATMQGYTQRELEENFAPWLEEIEAGQPLPHDAFLAKIKEWYDGFRFHSSAETVYNPVSIAKFLIQRGEFNNYWFSTGTPSFLMKLVMGRDFSFGKTLSRLVPQIAFEAFELDRLEPLPLLLQTGYLTIRSAEQKRGQTCFRLDFPNLEVGESFTTYLLNAYIGRSRQEAPDFRDRLADALEACDLPALQRVLESFFAGIGYDVHHKSEANFQNIFYTIFRMLGYIIHAEARTSDGRIDAAVEVPGAVYIFEFKLDGDPGALAQIYEKTYYQSWLATEKRIFLVGCSFSTETGRIASWQAEEYLLNHHV